MVLRETQRAFVYFSLHGLTVDWIIANRVFPEEVNDQYFSEWQRLQAETLREMDAYFDPVKVKRVPLFTGEVLGIEKLEELAIALYAEEEDPSKAANAERPYSFLKVDGHYRN